MMVFYWISVRMRNAIRNNCKKPAAVSRRKTIVSLPAVPQYTSPHNTTSSSVPRRKSPCRTTSASSVVNAKADKSFSRLTVNAKGQKKSSNKKLEGRG
jgi:hypothetical protein